MNRLVDSKPGLSSYFKADGTLRRAGDGKMTTFAMQKMYKILKSRQSLWHD